MSHTPGPWIFNPSTLDIRTLGYSIESEALGYQEVICACQTVDGDMPPEDIERRMADAKLIAAAPEMLELLKTASNAILNGCETREDSDNLIGQIDALIAKAEGKR